MEHPTQRSATWKTAVLAWLVGAVAGCSSSGHLDTARVRGTVTLDGNPVTQGTVSFTPERGRGGSGQIGPDGSFTISTYKEGDGAIVGHHKVAIVSIDRRGTTSGGEDNMDRQIVWLIPQRYGNPYTSGLTFEVKAGTNNVATFELTSRGGP